MKKKIYKMSFKMKTNYKNQIKNKQIQSKNRFPNKKHFNLK